MPNVQMPNGDIVAFPDDMPREQIKGLIASKFPSNIPENKPKVDMFDTVSDQALQGATFGLGNRAQAGLAAAALSLADDKPFMDTIGDNYEKARKVGSLRLAEESLQNPGTAIAANLAGGLATGGLAATTKAGAATGNLLRSGGTIARMGKGALAGSASGAAYGAGTADYGKSGEGAVEGAIYGGVAGGAIPAVGAAVKSSAQGIGNIVKGATARGFEELNDVSNALRQRSGVAYQAMRDAGAIFKPETSQNIVGKIDSALKTDGILNQGLHGKTMSVLDDMRQAAKANDFGLENLDQWRQLLGEVVSDGTDKIKGVSSDARKAQLAIRQIDDVVNGLDDKALASGNSKAIDALRGARAEWAKARRFESVADIVKKSDGDANYLKRELKKLADDPRRTRGWNDAEKAALREASSLSAGEGIMKMLGKFGFDLGNSRIGSGVGAIVGSGAGGIVSGGTGAVLAPVVGTAARYGQKAIGRGKTETLLNTIEGIAKAPKIGQAVSPILSAPAGAVAGSISGAESRAPMRLTITPQDKLPTPEVDLPTVSPRSDNADYLEQIKMAESGGNPNARNPNSSASGLFQFTDATWADSVRKWGNELGVGMNDKDNPQAQEAMARKLADDNARILTAQLDIEPTVADMYTAHFLGAGDAVKLIKAQGTNTIAARLFPKAAMANRSIFFDRTRPRTVEEVYQILGSKVA